MVSDNSKKEMLPKGKIQKLFLSHNEHTQNKIHFAAHSHHPWPDVSKDAHLQYWIDSSRLIDDKWEYIFTEVIPKVQKKIANMLNLSDENQIALAPNTHELVVRLFSTFDTKKPIRILSTQNEFHSFRRQTMRMEEEGLATVTRLQADQIGSNRADFIAQVKSELQTGNYDLLFISQVFFDSGHMLSTEELLDIAEHKPSSTVMCIDGYHAFCALPLDYSALEGKVFFLAGGYKYAQAGEGVCFLVVPKEGDWRPVNTGWMADIGHLASSASTLVQYPNNGSAFIGATQDASGFYRFNAVWDMYAKEGVDIAAIHSHVLALQEMFIEHVPGTLFADYALINAESPRGHFLTFDMRTAENCAAVHDGLRERGVLTDYRGQRLRIGFGLYQSADDVMQLVLATQQPVV